MRKMFSIGAVKTALSRVAGYISYLNFGLLYMNTVKIFELEFYQSVFLAGFFIFIGAVITYIDFKYVLAQEQKFQTNKNPIIIEIRESLKRIEGKI